MNSSPGEACPWGPYRHTTLRIGIDGTLHRIDLSQPVQVGVARALERALGARFAIVTAFNPFFLSRGACSAEENLANHARLRAELARRSLAFIEADGHANGARDHVERGFAIACGRAVAHELACAFGQDAYFDYEDGHFWIHPALDEGKPSVRLPNDGTIG